MGFATINTNIWENNSFTIETGLTYFWLITTNYKNKIGCFNAPIKIISFFTGLSKEQVKVGLNGLKEEGLIDFDGSEVLVYQESENWTSSNTYIASLYKELNSVKSERLKNIIKSLIEKKENENNTLNEDRKIVFLKYNGRCSYCGILLDFKNFHIDHIKPRKSGGENNIKNYNPACAKCNLQKSNRNLEEYRFYLDKKMKHKFFFEV